MWVSDFGFKETEVAPDAATYSAWDPDGLAGKTVPQTSSPGSNPAAIPASTTTPEKSRPKVSGSPPSFDPVLTDQIEHSFSPRHTNPNSYSF